MANFVEYLKETRGEMKHVSWPTQKQVISYTTLVVGLSLFTAAVLGVFDALFTYLLEKFILS